MNPLLKKLQIHKKEWVIMEQKQLILFARIGYMQYYQGVDSERPIGGGYYNENEIGHEAFNFKQEADGFCYGYVQPPRGTTDNENPRLNIGRIDPARKREEFVENVLVVWIATRPKEYGGGQYVVGWYKNATVYREFQKIDKNIDRHPLKDFHYNIKCYYKDAVLLPTNKRKIYIPKPNKGNASMGQANVYYTLDAKGFLINNLAKELKKAIELTKMYAGPNLVTKEDWLLDIQSQYSYEPNPKIRKTIEDYAMKKCIRHYENIGFKCEDVSQRESFDVLAQKGSCTLKIEVKGTRGAGDKVILTKKEVELAKQKETILFLVRNIHYNEKTDKASGGEENVLEWKISDSSLIALSYSYQIS